MKHPNRRRAIRFRSMALGGQCHRLGEHAPGDACRSLRLAFAQEEGWAVPKRGEDDDDQQQRCDAEHDEGAAPAIRRRERGRQPADHGAAQRCADRKRADRDRAQALWQPFARHGERIGIGRAKTKPADNAPQREMPDAVCLTCADRCQREDDGRQRQSVAPADPVAEAAAAPCAKAEADERGAHGDPERSPVDTEIGNHQRRNDAQQLHVDAVADQHQHADCDCHPLEQTKRRARQCFAESRGRRWRHVVSSPCL